MELTDRQVVQHIETLNSHVYLVSGHLVFAVDNQEIGRIESVTDTSIPWAELASFEENEVNPALNRTNII